MGKQLRQTPITEQDLVDYLKTEQDDFLLEMEVVRICRQKNFNVSHGGPYVDPVSGKSRQFDVRAIIGDDKQMVLFAIECKSLRKNFPLLISKTPRTDEEAYHELVVRSPLVNAPGNTTSQRLTVTPYGKGLQVGKATTQVGRGDKDRQWVSGDDEVFEKWAQAIASAYDLIVHAETRGRTDLMIRAWNLVIPILVVPEGTLWVADYSKDAELQGTPRSVDECEFFIGKKYPLTRTVLDGEYTISHLHIATTSGLAKLLGRFSSNPRYLHQWFPEI